MFYNIYFPKLNLSQVAPVKRCSRPPRGTLTLCGGGLNNYGLTNTETS